MISYSSHFILINANCANVKTFNILIGFHIGSKNIGYTVGSVHVDYLHQGVYTNKVEYYYFTANYSSVSSVNY